MPRIAQALHALALLTAGLGLFALARRADLPFADALAAHAADAFSPLVGVAGLLAVGCGIAAWAVERRGEGAVRESLLDAHELASAENSDALPRDERRQLRKRLEELVRRAEPDAVGFLDLLLDAAVRAGASDVHLQPLGSGTRVTFRIQGALDEIVVVPLDVHAKLVRRIKILADLVVYQTSLPQDGAFSFDAANGPSSRPQTTEARVSTVPTHHGEKVALRLAHTGAGVAALAELGMPDSLARAFEELLAEPQGLIVLTGPTGSGKTTTIYSSLAHIHRARGRLTNMATIEDPIEHHLPFLNQTQVDQRRGLTFAGGLRALLRQDPNVMMVGEIRDEETAQIAIQAGLTGHLVLTTLHAESSAGVFNRLIDTGLEPFLVASSTLACLSQRLVQRLCPSCRRPEAPSRALARRLERQGVELGERVFHVAEGCEACGGRGVLGRTAIYEMLRVTPALRRHITARSTTDDLRAAALAEGMTPLIEAAVEVAARGEISLEEALRVVGG